MKNKYTLEVLSGGCLAGFLAIALNLGRLAAAVYIIVVILQAMGVL